MSDTMKVLIVEDSPIQAKIMADHVRDRGAFEVAAAASLAETKEIMDAEGENIFVAVLDLNLPDDPDQGIVSLAVERRIPAIVMTASFKEEVRQKLLENNVVDYFLKSMTEVENMVRLIERLQKNRDVEVIVADDSKLARSRLTTLLKNQNYRSVEAEDGEQALALLQSHPETRLLITDYNMPRMDGFELITEVRKTHGRDRLAIIGVSGEDGGQTARFLKIGANDFLTKPIRTEEFYCRVNQQMDMMDTLADYNRLRQRYG